MRKRPVVRRDARAAAGAASTADDTRDGGAQREPQPEHPSLRTAVRARKRAERAEVRRFTRRRRGILRGWLLGLGVIAVLIGFVAVAVFTPIMSVRSVEVLGTKRLTAAQVADALAPLHGKPLALVSNRQVQDLLGTFVLVQSYTVQRTPPSTLTVRIVEREPVGTVKVGEDVDVVDAAGVVLWRVGDAAAPGAAAPLTVPELQAGSLGNPAFLAAGRVSLSLDPELRTRVRTVAAQTPESVTLQLDGGVTVNWGSARDSARKAQVLQALLAATSGSGATYYDVSSPDTPVSR